MPPTLRDDGRAPFRHGDRTAASVGGVAGLAGVMPVLARILRQGPLATAAPALRHGLDGHAGDAQLVVDEHAP